MTAGPTVLHVCLASSWAGQEMYMLELAGRQQAEGRRHLAALDDLYGVEA